MKAFLEVHNLSKSFGEVVVLQNVNFCLFPQQNYALMGRSGSGKTTLLRILMGLESADSGELLWQGASPRISAVFQEDRLCETFSPLENIRMVLPQRYPQQRLLEECAKLLPKEALSRPVSTLSGGMKRRVAILRAVLAPSDFLILDEPFSGLDETTKSCVIRYLLEKSAGRSILFTTHNSEEVAQMQAQPLPKFAKF
ncbi:MAG: ABC transporter ATP-binding protein [bacterium]|nr:ABC transporter ATP-binding protein [bacterium]